MYLPKMVQLNGYIGHNEILYPVQLNAVLSGWYSYARALGVSDKLYKACQRTDNKQIIDSALNKIYNR